MIDRQQERGTARGPATEIAWRRLGSGKPLLLINGYAATKDDWDPTFLEALGQASTVIAPDNRGVGESGTEGEYGPTIRDMATDALAVLDQMGVASTPVVGWSMGGFIAQELAALAPERVDALALLSTDPGGALAKQRDPDTDRLLKDHSGEPEEQAERLLGLLFPPDVARQMMSEYGAIVAEARSKLSTEVLTAQEKAMDRWYAEPCAARLGESRHPTLCAAGTLDRVIPPVNAEILAEHIPGSWLARFADGGHAFIAQEPRRLAALINAFLDRSPK